MKKFNFTTAKKISSQEEIFDLLDTDKISVSQDTVLTLVGQISLGDNLSFEGNCFIGDGSLIHNGGHFKNIKLGNNNIVRPYSILENLSAGRNNIFGPFCFIRNDCIVANNCILGSHVEATRSCFEQGVKISHHAFIGDARIGEYSTVGANVVFCNHDGKNHQKTQIGSNVILGSGSLIIAPLSVGSNSLIAAGSLISNEIPVGSKIIQKRD